MILTSVQKQHKQNSKCCPYTVHIGITDVSLNAYCIIKLCTRSVRHQLRVNNVVHLASCTPCK